CAYATPSSSVPNVAPPYRSGRVTWCPAARSTSANSRTPSVSPCAWWKRITSVIALLRLAGGHCLTRPRRCTHIYTQRWTRRGPPSLPQMDDVAGKQACRVGSQVRDDLGNLGRRGHVDQHRAVGHRLADRVGDPSGVGNRRVHHV